MFTEGSGDDIRLLCCKKTLTVRSLLIGRNTETINLQLTLVNNIYNS